MTATTKIAIICGLIYFGCMFVVWALVHGAEVLRHRWGGGRVR